MLSSSYHCCGYYWNSDHTYNNKYYYGSAFLVEHMHFQLLHKPRPMFSLRDPHDARQLARASRATISPTLQQITFSWLAFRPFTCLAGSSRDTTLRGRPGATDVRTLSKNRELLAMLGISTIKSARWNGMYLRGKYLFSQSFREIVP